MEYTHNLKLLLVNNSNQMVKDDVFLQKIKNILCKNNTCVLEWNGKSHNFTYQWTKKELNEIQNNLMGDLFTCPIYEFDNILVKHVQQILSKIETDYKIIFYISRIIGKKQINKDSTGIINKDSIII